MKQLLVGFHRDGHCEWVAELSCGHAQHIRHRPLFELRPWVLDDVTRNASLGTGRDCPLCDLERGGEAACATLELVRESGGRVDEDHPLRCQVGTAGSVVTRSAY